jgi:hypothetical protein
VPGGIRETSSNSKSTTSFIAGPAIHLLAEKEIALVHSIDGAILRHDAKSTPTIAASIFQPIPKTTVKTLSPPGFLACLPDRSAFRLP